MSAQKQPAGRAVRRANEDGAKPGDHTLVNNFASRIERAVARQPKDHVRCIHLFDDYYRCNWWAPLGVDVHRNQAEWVIGAMSRVRKSSFLAATLKGQSLVIEEIDGSGMRALLAVDEGLAIEQHQNGSVIAAASTDPVAFKPDEDEQDDESQAPL